MKRTVGNNSSALCVADRKFYLRLLPDAGPKLDCKRRGWCSGESEEECLETCHHITGQQCQWRTGELRPRSASLTYSYSSCVGRLTTCPDSVCDGLEELDQSLCPQDCVSQKKIRMSLLVNTSPASRGIPSVKAPNMSCGCDQSSCQCFHSRYQTEEASPITSHLTPCDDHCILLVTAAASLGLATVLVITGVWRKRESLCSRYVKNKAKDKVQYEEGFLSELEDYSRQIFSSLSMTLVFAFLCSRSENSTLVTYSTQVSSILYPSELLVTSTAPNSHYSALFRSTRSWSSPARILSSVSAWGRGCSVR